MLTVHHLEQSRSHRILWLLEELELPYEVVHYKRDPQTMLAPPSLRSLHPLGKSPIVTDTDGNVTLAESGAIVEYLVEKYGNGRLVPKAGTEAKRRYTYFLHYAEASAMPPLLLALVFSKVANNPAPFFVKPILKKVASKVMRAFVTPQLELHFGFVEAELGKHKWFAGDEFTAADIQMSFALEGAVARGGFKGRAPHIEAWLDAVHARPAYKRAVAKGGEFSVAS